MLGWLRRVMHWRQTIFGSVMQERPAPIPLYIAMVRVSLPTLLSVCGSFADLDTSYSWSTNIAGRKRWRMVAPEDASLLRRACQCPTDQEFPERRTSELASTFDEMEKLYTEGELGSFQEGKRGWPGWHQVRNRAYVVVQEVSVLRELMAARTNHLCSIQLVPPSRKSDRLSQCTYMLLTTSLITTGVIR